MKYPNQVESKMKELGIKPTDYLIVISIHEQKMTLFHKKESIITYTVSTSERGTGQVEDSLQTPLGLHCVADKIGEAAAAGAIFKGREDTGQTCPLGSAERRGEDLILTRILRLKGLEEGFNRGYDREGRIVDSFERFIYIHGTNHEEQLGMPASHGCVRMGNADVIDLFERVPEGTLVWIAQ